MKTTFLAFATFVTASAPSLTAQRSPVPEIERAAAGYARSLHLSGKVVFDPRPAYEKGMAPSRSAQEIDILAKVLGATSVADQSNYIVCPSTHGKCRIIGANAIISVNRPEVFGDTAYAIVRVLAPTAFPSHPINSREDRLLIVKEDGAWKFVKLVGGGSIN
jgi:hypothetical protein